jgi:hypothetical protein
MSTWQMAELLDSSWLADDRLFCFTHRLRAAATRSRWRVDAARQQVALGLFQLEKGAVAQNLQELVPKYFPAGLPTDPYSGQPFHYRLAPKDDPAEPPGSAILWSTGPDRQDDGGRFQGDLFADDDVRWDRGGFDLIVTVRAWQQEK